ncbi:protein of unknown function [Paraburkholderia kururiensis]|uniref:retroviral-like aspartic protease family protein n=1 Tax=Paraburkholderia kururiensis TaxID=984307 RepID=UPI0039A59CF8
MSGSQNRVVPYARYGMIEGEVTELSNDATQDGKRGFVFTARVHLKTDRMRIDNQWIALTPGMAVTTETRTGRQTVALYLPGPLVEGVRKACRNDNIMKRFSSVSGSRRRPVAQCHLWRAGFAMALIAGSPGLNAADAVEDAQKVPGFSQLAQMPAPDHCTVLPDAQMPLSDGHGRVLSPVDVERRPLMMLIDSGAGNTGLSPQTADALNENEDRSKSVRVSGIGGRMDAQHPLVVHSIRFGSLDLVDFDVLTAHIERPEVESDAASAAGLIGLDLLSRFDVEFDFPDHRMSLYHVTSCSGRFIPWSGRYDSFMATRSPRGALIIPVVVNGVTLRALIDTGLNVSSMGLAAAARAGVDANAMANDPRMTFAGAKGALMTAHQHRFDTISVGAATFHNARMSVQDQDFPGTDMLLGMDFLRWRKVWLSFATNQVFIQYVPRQTSRNPVVPAPSPSGGPAGISGHEAGPQ